jgi:hypothetical protein
METLAQVAQQLDTWRCEQTQPQVARRWEYLLHIKPGASCTAVGVSAAQTNSGSSCTAVGVSALQTNTGASCTAVGVSAAQSNIGASCTAVGVNAAFSNTGQLHSSWRELRHIINTGANITAVG